MGFYCYVGTLACGCSPAACVDEPKYQKDTAKSVADMIGSGMTVERVFIADGETVSIHSCIHQPVELKDQQSLFAS